MKFTEDCNERPLTCFLLKWRKICEVTKLLKKQVISMVSLFIGTSKKAFKSKEALPAKNPLVSIQVFLQAY